MPLLQAVNISKSYDEVVALSDFSFSLEKSEVVALLGANGSGKTTSIKAICSLLELDGGAVEFEGLAINRSTNYLKHIGAVLEGARNIHWRLTPMQNAEYFSTLKGSRWVECKPRAEELHEMLGLQNYRNTESGKLSTGFRQKAAILCALCHDPKLVLLDEPTIGLDLETVAQLKDFLHSQSQSQHQSFLVTSHDFPFIDEICDRVIVLNEGRNVFDGTLHELKNRVHSFELTLETQSRLDESHLQVLLSNIDESNTQSENSERSLSLRYLLPETGMKLIAQANTLGIAPTSLEINKISMAHAYKQLVMDEQQAGGAK